MLEKVAVRVEDVGASVRPLVVDLDGTLVHEDTLLESLTHLLGTRPLAAAGCVVALWDGRAAFKASVAERYAPILSDLTLNEDVLRFVRSEAARRPVILATAAHRSVAEAVARDVGLFDLVVSSDGASNVKGAKKLTAIRHALHAAGYDSQFDYIGDSRADRPLWRAAVETYVVAPTDRRADELAGGVPITRRFNCAGGGSKAVFRAMRPYQWSKNALIFVPLVVGHTFSAGSVAMAILAFIAFSITASATYLWNDILDRRADRRHATKRDRPIASGALSLAHAWTLSIGLLAATMLIAIPLGLAPLALLVGYIVISLTYSSFLKRKLLIDVMILGLLYGYRVLFGAVATGIVVSDWLIAFSGFFFLGLALIKRFTEIDAFRSEPYGKIPNRGYYGSDREVVGMIGIGSSLVSSLVLALYVTSDDVAVLYSFSTALWGCVAVSTYWIARAWVLAYREHMPDDPIVFALRDRVSWACAATCAAFILIALPT